MTLWDWQCITYYYLLLLITTTRPISSIQDTAELSLIPTPTPSSLFHYALLYYNSLRPYHIFRPCCSAGPNCSKILAPLLVLNHCAVNCISQRLRGLAVSKSRWSLVSHQTCGVGQSSADDSGCGQRCGVFKYHLYLNTKSATKSTWSTYLNTPIESGILRYYLNAF